MNTPFRDGLALEQAINAARGRLSLPHDEELRRIWMMQRTLLALHLIQAAYGPSKVLKPC